MQDLNGTFGPGKKREYLIDLAKKIMSSQLRKKKELVFVSDVVRLREKMIASLKRRQITCRFSSAELMIGLLKSPKLVGQISVSSTKDGMQMITAFSEEMQRLVEILRPLASDYRPEAPVASKDRKVVRISDRQLRKAA